MFERSEAVLKVLCVCILALLAYQVARIAVRGDPLANIKIPVVPTLPSSKPDAKSKDDQKPSPDNTRSPAASKPATNSVTQGTNQIPPTTNVVAKAATPAAPAINVTAHGTNAITQGTSTAPNGTNDVAQGTNAVAQGTNAVAPGTNTNSQPQLAGTTGARGASSGPGRNGPRPGGMRGMPGAGPELPSEVKTQVQRIIDSEILAPVMHPLPMALLGIAGQDIFLRTPDGQTGLVKEGGELGGVKVLRVAVNRVLVEQGGEKKELTIFEGLGSETLLSKQTDHHP